MAEQPTVFLLVRHLTSIGAQAREGFFDPSLNYAMIPQYRRIKDKIKSVKGQSIPLEKAQELHNELDGDLKTVEAFLDRSGYAKLGPDKDLSLIPGENERGKKIGEALKLYLDRTFGRGIERTESSPFERALSTAEAVLYSADPNGLDIHINPNIRERQNGHAVEEVSYRDIFIASNPQELMKWSKMGDDYKGPGRDAETENEFERRVRSNVRRMRKSQKYEGHVNALFTHSENIGETIRQLGIIDKRYIQTGSVTVVTAEPRTRWERITLRPRKLVVGDTIDFVLPNSQTM